MLKKVLNCFTVVSLLALASAAQATDITGDTVRVTHYFPDASSVNAELGTAAVMPTASFNYGGAYDLVVSGTSLTVDLHCGQGCSWSDSSFNGPVLEDLTSSPFTSMHISAASNYAGFDASRLTFDANHIYMNFSGLDANGFLQVDFGGSDVPEPASLALFGLTLAGLAVARRRKS